MSATEAEAPPQLDQQCRAHPTNRVLHRFVMGTTSPAENRAIVVHLLRKCDGCSRVLAEAFEELEKAILRRSAETAS